MNQEDIRPPATAIDPDPAPPALRRLRLWPAVIIVGLQLAAMYGPSLLLDLQAEPSVAVGGVAVEGSLVDNPQVVLISKALGPLVGAALLFLWWVGFSRASWQSRIIGPLVFAALGAAGLKLMHWTMTFGFVLYSIPTATVAALAALYVFRGTPFPRRGAIALGIVGLVFGSWTLVRMDGVDGDLRAQLSWRWSATPEQRLLADRVDPHVVEPADFQAPQAITAPDWPGFRGRDRDGRVTSGPIRTDWPRAGLPAVWRMRIGPGWSSFCLVGRRLFTQEQRGDDEVVSAYDADTGSELWVHRDKARFVEFISGVGPRATPTFAEGRLYTTGANGTVNCLDPETGAVFWTRNIAEDADATIPMWGFSSSPLVQSGLAIVFTGAGQNRSLIAYDAQNGEVRWMAGNGMMSYSSAHSARLHDVPQILMMTDIGLTAYAPDTGAQLWQHAWRLGGGSPRVIQPALLGNDVLIGTGYGHGTRRITVAREDDAWSTTERWTSRALKPYFNDFVVQGGHAFGFDGSIFTCVDLDTGKRLWKRGRYGSGQVLLVRDQKLLLVLSEEGELVLLAADPQQHRELHRFQAIEGKTWNHPVLANGRLFVRNAVEAACFDLRPPAE